LQIRESGCVNLGKSIVKFVLFSAICAIVWVGFAVAVVVCACAKAILDTPTVERITKAATAAEKSFLLIIFHL
jgi:hypothetical protein